MSKSTFDDLKKAILEVLYNATSAQALYDTYDDDTDLVVPLRMLKNLQAEYNIYFVEPENKQVDLI